MNLDAFRNLQGSKATGAQNIGRLTNLMNLNVDTSWYIRYRSTTNPDLGATFPQAITINNRTAIPRTDADMKNATAIQVIANTAAFHFGTIEQGGSSLYASLSRKVTSEQVLEITLGIGGDEVAHFLEWVDFAGNGVQPPVAPVSFQGLTFPDFTTKGPLFQPNLIFPVPCRVHQSQASPLRRDPSVDRQVRRSAGNRHLSHQHEPVRRPAETVLRRTAEIGGCGGCGKTPGVNDKCSRKRSPP